MSYIVGPYSSPKSLTDQLVVASFQYPQNPAAPVSGGLQHGPQMAAHQPRPERNIKDVNEAKAARRVEIERRCAALDPPLLPGVLRHMESFQAATQISQPMTDQAWEILRPRLLSQLPYAERREREQVQQTEILAEEYRQRRQQEAQLKETRENFDREWENHQAPVRQRIGALANEVIESRWAGGKAVTKESSPKFAADVLLDVRQRFYAALAQENEAALAAGESVKTDTANGPPTRRLILENMKWLFDTKIKPLTDHFQRELFLCNGCDGNYKFYGFEGVIQHYAAKHTTTLSMGNIVVHWRSEWPEHPPFNPNPSVAKTSFYKIPTPAPPAQAARDSRGTATYGNFVQPADTSTPTGASQHQNPQYPTVGYPNAYPGLRQEGPAQALPTQPYPPANSSHGAGSNYLGAQSCYGSGTASYNTFPSAPQGQVTAQYGSFPGQQGYPAFPQGQRGMIPQSYFAEARANSYGGRSTVPYPGNLQKGPLATLPQVHSTPGQVSDLYQRQMDEMAKHAKEVFTGMGGVKDLPGSVRIHVVIQHTVARFKASFPNEPSLSMFIDGLDHHAVMRPVRSVNGLGCKICMKNGTGAKLYTLPHLVNHFRTAHVETPQMLGYAQAPELDWKHDMIDYPNLSVISRLLHASGMTDAKLSLIASVFPDAFPAPLPTLKSRTNNGPHPMLYRKEPEVNTKGAPGAVSNPLVALSSHGVGQSTDQSFNRPHSAFRPLSSGRSSEPLEPPGEDEYDPHRPAYLGKIVKIGNGSTQSHKSSQRSPLRDGRRHLSYAQQESPHCALPPRLEDEPSHNSVSAPRPDTSEHYPRESYEPFEHVKQPQSPIQSAMSRSEHLFHQYAPAHPKPTRQDNVDEHDTSMDYLVKHGRTPEDGRLGEMLSAVKRGAQGESPPEVVVAADRFLSTLAPKPEGARSLKRFSSERDAEHDPQATWLSEPAFKRRQQYFGQDGAYDHRLGDEVKIERQENDVPEDHTRTGGPPEPGNGSHTAVPQRLSHYFSEVDGLRPFSWIPANSVVSGGSPPGRYIQYEDSEQVVLNDRLSANGSVLKRPGSGSHTYQVSRTSQYRDQPGSPQRPPAETTLYRPRSPIEEDRHNGVYEVRSPSSRRMNRSQRVPNYEYPTQTPYEYFDDPGVPNSHYRQRVEYVPIRYEDSELREPARYVIARPVEQMSPEYIRYKASYGTKPIYDLNGQVYDAPPRTYQDPYEGPSFVQSHQY